jgi:hypothetical protein
MRREIYSFAGFYLVENPVLYKNITYAFVCIAFFVAYWF